MGPRFEKTFVVAVPRGTAWRAFADSTERSRWEAPVHGIDPKPGGRIHYEFPDGTANDGVVQEVKLGQLLRHIEPHGPGETEVAVLFEDVEGGTRITIVHSGFGEGGDWVGIFEATSLAWTQAIADLVVYLERGVVPERFVRGSWTPV